VNEAIGLILIFTGAIISVIGSIGLIRFPDAYTRVHAQNVVSIGGTCLLLLGVLVYAPFPTLYSAKSILLIIFILLTSPVGSHAIVRSAYKSGVKPRKLNEDELSYKIMEDEKPPAKKKYIKAEKSRYIFRPKKKGASRA
jgi:multicomponent Na+:H+ antiporter subunit G